MVITPDQFSDERDRRSILPDFGWTRRNRGGLWLPGPHWFPGYPCCCGGDPECALCNFGNNDCIIPGEFIADLDVGGWTDDLCGGCDEVAGEFTLSIDSFGNCRELAYCQWRYVHYEHCTFACPTPYDYPLDIMYRILNSGAEIYHWTQVKIAPFGSYALYATAAYDTTDCMVMADGDGKITLTKYAEDLMTYPGPTCAGQAACGGALPNTIEAWPVDGDWNA